jgi:Leucine-rich repeat (LRR) protein
LRLHSNQFTGEIPSTIGNLTNLYDLNLHSNQFTGEIPSTIGNLTNLYNLNLHSNQLTREIPEEICNQGDSTPSIVNNKLCPPYPECIEDYVGYQDTTNCSFVSVTINNLSGWNLTGLPLNVENPDYLFLFPSAVEGTLYSFDDGYNLEANLMQGEGYWLRFNESGNTTISGTPINELTISLNEGWNLIPGISTPIEISAIQDPDEIIIFGTVYEFTSGGYLNTDNIEPGKGYWIRTNGSGSITLIGD